MQNDAGKVLAKNLLILAKEIFTTFYKKYKMETNLLVVLLSCAYMRAVTERVYFTHVTYVSEIVAFATLFAHFPGKLCLFYQIIYLFSFSFCYLVENHYEHNKWHFQDHWKLNRNIV